MSTSVSGIASEAIKTVNAVSKQKEEIIFGQLNDLISRGLLVWEQGPEILTYSIHEPYKLILSSKGRLVLKDQEYVEKLEKEVEYLKGKLEVIRKAVE